MNELKAKIHDEVNGLDYILVGDYYIPAIELPEDDDRPIGKRMLPSMGSVTVPITQTTAGRAAASTARTGNA